MVKKKSILKDAIREISFTKKRFISLVLVITLGVGFYIGLKSTSLDMKNTAKRYYQETNLMDVKIQSTTGFYEDDYNTLKSIEGINGIMMVKSVDAKASVKNEDYLIKAIGINDSLNNNDEDYINRLTLTSGTFPKTINEGLVEESFLKDNGLKIGDLVTLEPNNDQDLKAKKIKIVGTVKNSYYSSNDRGSSSIENKQNDYFIYLEEKNISSDTYTEIYTTIDGAKKLDTYGKEYKKLVKEYQEKITSILTPIINDRYEEYKTILENNISSLNESLNGLYSLEFPEESLNESIKQISTSLEQSKMALSNLKSPMTYTTSRNETPSFYEFKLETERIEKIAKIFPLIFFLVAALVSLTSMTRIVEEERNQIGTLRAIGYSVFDTSFKYVLYALLASILGSILGTIIFYKLIPMVIWLCYGTFYDIPNLSATFQLNHVLFAFIFSVIATVLASVIAIINDIIQVPAKLMRPKSPKPGKRVLLERITPIWKKLKFSNKVTFRNVFRYKKRLFMTVVGISGSTALLLTAFGLRDSVTSICDKQFDEISKYDLFITLNLTDNETSNSVKKKINENKKIKNSMRINQSIINVKDENINEQVYLIIPENKKELNDYITLKERKKEKEITLDDTGIVITEKLAELLEKKENDKISINLPNGDEKKVKISKITENYIDHYIYMSPALYKKLTNEDIKYNSLLVNTSNTKNEKITMAELSEIEHISSITSINNTKEQYKEKMQTLNYVTIILIISSACLAFVVLYNLSNVNISERKRELATVKILGFYDNEVTNYVHKENVILTIIGSVVGLVIGSFLTYYVIKVCETNLFMFSFDISILSYVASFMITLFFLFIVNIFMHYDLKKLDMVNALKSVE